jgi:hypothetical protein
MMHMKRTSAISRDPSSTDQLLPLVYDELRKLAAAKLSQENPGQTLQATALVHDQQFPLVCQVLKKAEFLICAFVKIGGKMGLGQLAIRYCWQEYSRRIGGLRWPGRQADENTTLHVRVCRQMAYSPSFVWDLGKSRITSPQGPGSHWQTL